MFPALPLFLSLSAAYPAAQHVQSRQADNGTSTLQNNDDVSYYVSLTLGGQHYSVLVDTGSSDLWIAGDAPPESADLEASCNVTYADGLVQGPVYAADLAFSGFAITNQAFMLVAPDDSHPAGQGILGLGPHDGSAVYETLGAPAGFPILDRIFQQNTSTSNYITLLMGRQQDSDEVFSGNISISTISTGLEAVLDQPHLPVTMVPIDESKNQHFQVLLDHDGLRGPDGKLIRLTTEVEQTGNNRQATVLVDSGFSLSQVPKSAADAIYGRIEGAEFRELGSGIGKTWIVPCTHEVNVTFKLGGVEYPIHPMDVAMDPAPFGLNNLTNEAGDASCIGMFQPMVLDLGASPTFDIILGMPFLRNTYTLFDYGDFIDDEANQGDPYIQLLSITDPAEAHVDFVNVRLGGNDTTGNQTLKPAQALDTPSSSWSRGAIIGTSIGVFAVLCLFAAAITWWCRRRRYVPVRTHRSRDSVDASTLPQTPSAYFDYSPAYTPPQTPGSRPLSTAPLLTGSWTPTSLYDASDVELGSSRPVSMAPSMLEVSRPISMAPSISPARPMSVAQSRPASAGASVVDHTQRE
ncbi:acid protease [Cylindrobasidium torrendii FP15055 ss-10]|uniref:Acid protease n=1 Tax=Cylindrobasidium torrendii FP15055 ss-10 TaxID=1314674 RepID=A0A0D7B126_9AGAR|nr:acid protease [Cylindrobasidium torrendii FP15055 ss-10]